MCNRIGLGNKSDNTFHRSNSKSCTLNWKDVSNYKYTKLLNTLTTMKETTVLAVYQGVKEFVGVSYNVKKIDIEDISSCIWSLQDI